MTDIRLRKMNPGQIGKYARFIPREDIPDALAGKKRVLGIDDGNTPVGAFVTYTGKEPDNGSGEALVIKKMYLFKEYDSIGVMNSTVALILGYAEEKKPRNGKGDRGFRCAIFRYYQLSCINE